MQVISRRAGKWNNGTPEIDFGLLDYGNTISDDYRLGIRAGRVRMPYGIYNDTRDVAFTRPSILLPQSIYYEAARDIMISADGLLVYGESRKPWGNLTLELFGGYPRTDSAETQFSNSFNFPVTLAPEPSFIGRLNYDAYDGSMRFALSGGYVSAKAELNSPFFPQNKGSITYSPILLSAQYNTDKWTFTSEFYHAFFSSEGLGLRDASGNIIQDFNYSNYSYFFQAAYRFAPKWELMTRYDAMMQHNDTTSICNSSLIRPIEPFCRFIPPSYYEFAKTFTVGLRYDITSSMMIRAEYNYVNGTAWLPVQGVPTDVIFNKPDYSKTSQYWNVFGLQVSVRF